MMDKLGSLGKRKQYAWAAFILQKKFSICGTVHTTDREEGTTSSSCCLYSWLAILLLIVAHSIIYTYG